LVLLQGFLHVISFHTPMVVWRCCIYEWFYFMCANVLLCSLSGMFLTEISEACLASKICQQLCRVVSPGGAVKYCHLDFMGKFCKYVMWDWQILVTYDSTLTAGFIPAFVGLFSVDWSMNETPAGGVSSAGETDNKVRQSTIAGSGHASKMLLSIILQYRAKNCTL
jgi:hypothetical protein